MTRCTPHRVMYGPLGCCSGRSSPWVSVGQAVGEGRGGIPGRGSEHQAFEAGGCTCSRWSFYGKWSKSSTSPLYLQHVPPHRPPSGSHLCRVVGSGIGHGTGPSLCLSGSRRDHHGPQMFTSLDEPPHPSACQWQGCSCLQGPGAHSQVYLLMRAPRGPQGPMGTRRKPGAKQAWCLAHLRQS